MTSELKVKATELGKLHLVLNIHKVEAGENICLKVDCKMRKGWQGG